MSLRRFILQHADEIDAYVLSRPGTPIKLSNADRREWIMNDEYLYRWALSAGVRL